MRMFCRILLPYLLANESSSISLFSLSYISSFFRNEVISSCNLEQFLSCLKLVSELFAALAKSWSPHSSEMYVFNSSTVAELWSCRFRRHIASKLSFLVKIKIAHMTKKTTSQIGGGITLLGKIFWRERNILLKSCNLVSKAPFQSKSTHTARSCLWLLLKSSLHCQWLDSW